MKKFRFVVATICLTMVQFFASSKNADAAFVLVLSDGVTTKVVVDNSPAGTGTQNVGASTDADAAAPAGSISLTTSFGVWTITVSAAFSKPTLTGTPTIDMVFAAISSGAGTLTIGATDTSFPVPQQAGLRSVVGGVKASGATVTLQGEIDWTNNAEFSGSFGIDGVSPDALVSQVYGPGGPNAFSGVATVASAAPPTAFSLTNYVRVTHTGSGSTTGNHEVHVNPEPASLLVFAPVLGFIAARRRKARLAK